MVDEPREPRWDEERRAALAARRAERRSQIRRRRIAALLSLVGVIAGVVVVVAVASSGSGSGSAGETKGEIEGGRGKVRNSTPQAGWAPHTGPVPILEYHVLGEPPEGEAYPELFVTRPDFRHQLEWLDENGYEAVTLEQVEDAWYRGGTLPKQPVVLSFDDGYRPQFTFALPQLRKHGWAGLLDLKAEGSDLYESNVEAMIAAGWELAAHTIHHLDLTELGPAELEEEVTGSREMLQREFHVPVNDFCYPAGRFDRTVIEAVEAAGYEGATTEIPGYAEKDKPFELARFEILRSTGVSGLAEDLRTGEGATAEL